MVGPFRPELRPCRPSPPLGVGLVLAAVSLLVLLPACCDATWSLSRVVREPSSGATPTVQPLHATSPQPRLDLSGQTGADPTADVDRSPPTSTAQNRLHPAITRLWQVGSSLVGSPAIAPDGSIYLASRQGTLDVLEPNGVHRFSITLSGAPTGTMHVDERGWAYLGLATGKLVAITPEGRTYFTYDVPNGITGEIRFADDVGLLFLSRNDVVEGINRSGFLTMWIPYDLPIVQGPVGLVGWYVVATSRGDLVWGDRFGRRIRRGVGAPIRLIEPTSDSGLWVLADGNLVAFSAQREESFRRLGVIAMTVASGTLAARGIVGAAVTSSRCAEWIDASGRSVMQTPIGMAEQSGESLEIRLDDDATLWLVVGGEQLWLVRANGETGRPYTFGRGALLPPVIDGSRRRAIIATVDGAISQVDWPSP